MPNRFFEILKKLLPHRGKPTTEQPASPVPPAEPAPVDSQRPIPPNAPRPLSLMRFIRSALHLAKETFVRAYAGAILLLVLWAGYMAFMSLLRTVYVQTQVPKRFLEWQGHIDTQALRTEDVPGLTGPAARALLGHYHHVDRWFQVDSLNGCTVAGCHDPLPHSTKMRVPAFANFHTTFLTCQMCHAAPDEKASIGWISTANARPQDPPALLQLLSFIAANQELIRTKPADAHAIIVPLLAQSVAIVGNDPFLSDLLLQFQTAEPGSPVWKLAMDRLSRQLPEHARGEYGAKLARQNAALSYRDESDTLRDLADKFLAATVGGKAQLEIHRTIHGPLVAAPAACISCHSDSAGGMDFASLGYAPQRSKDLGQLQLARLMQRIRDGEQFYIPKLLGSGDGR